MADQSAGLAPPMGGGGAPTVRHEADARAADRRVQLRAAVLVVGVLAALGIVLGFVWEVWSPPGPLGVKLPAGIQPDESEAWAAGDGRFAFLGLIVGLVAGPLAWRLPALRTARGPYVALGLAVGGFAGSVLTVLIGWAVRGQGRTGSCGGGASCIDHLPLTVHMKGLWFLEPFAAVLVYGLFVAFAVSDDLGRPDPRNPSDPTAPSVDPQHGPQYGGGYGNAAGVPQQHDLAP